MEMAALAFVFGIVAWKVGEIIKTHIKSRPKRYVLTIHEKYLPSVLKAISEVDDHDRHNQD